MNKYFNSKIFKVQSQSTILNVLRAECIECRSAVHSSIESPSYHNIFILLL